MEYLKIERGKAYYQIVADSWKEIDQINKEDLLVLLDKAIEDEFEMDELQDISNTAHKIIYKHISQKFKELIQNKSRFRDESEQIYKSAIEKYSESLKEYE